MAIVINVERAEEQVPRNRLFYKVEFNDVFNNYFDSEVFELEGWVFENTKDSGTYSQLNDKIEELIEHYQKASAYNLLCDDDDVLYCENLEIEAIIQNWPEPEYQFNKATPVRLILQAYDWEGILYTQTFTI